MREWQWQALAVLAAAVFTLAVNGSSLSMGFGRDDGANLFNAVRLSPLTYFLDPPTLKAVSAYALTPWNLLVYSIGVALFGLDPAWHHFHLLVVVTACGFLTYWFLHLWLSPAMSLLGALLFLSGTPVMFISHEIMSGHYLYGLLFTIAASLCFVQAVRSGRWLPAAASALFFLLACACKEVFVPLPVVLLFLPEGRLVERLRASASLWLVVGGYFGWRWEVFEGHLLGPRGVGIDATVALRQFARIPSLLFGALWILPGAALALALWRASARGSTAVFALVLAGVLLAPLLPVTSGVGVRIPDRLLFLVWWVSASLLAIAAARVLGRWRFAPGLLIVILIAGQLVISLPWRRELAAINEKWAAWYGWVLSDASPGNLLLLADTDYFWQKAHIDGLRMAAQELGLSHNRRGRVIADTEGLAQSGPGAPEQYLVFDERTRVLRPAADTAEWDLWVARLPSKPPEIYMFRSIPRMAFLMGGSVQPPQVQGARVSIEGQVPDGPWGQRFLVLVPERCEFASLHRNVFSGSVTADAVRSASFRLELMCPTRESASRVAAGLCVVANNSGAMLVPAGQPNRECELLTRV